LLFTSFYASSLTFRYFARKCSVSTGVFDVAI